MSNEAKPEGGRDAYTRDRLQKIARMIDEELPQGWGFFLMAYPFNDAEGRMNYVSNGNRDDIKRLMQEFLSKGGMQEGHR
jgi:hypothetical protein